MCHIYKESRGFESNSTPRDAIFICADDKLYSIIPAIRSLRTVGCEARVILFANKKLFNLYDNIYFEKLENCGVEFVKIEPSERLVFSRFLFYYEYLKVHKNEFDRIIQMDAYDISIQYDPFTTAWSNTSQLYLQKENIPNNLYINNQKWIKQAYNNHNKLNSSIPKEKINPREICRNYIVNGGGQFGGPEILMKLDKVLSISAEDCNDQGLLNYVFYSGILEEKIGQKAIILPYPNDLFMTVAIEFVRRMRITPNNATQGKIYFDKNLPAIIHQYDRVRPFSNAVLESCPNYNPPFKDYIRRIG